MTKKIEKKATVIDLAKDTGLSLGTISKYLNGGKLKEFNRIKVEEAIKKRNYTVNLYARSLKTSKSNTVGIVIPEFANAFYGKLLTLIGSELSKRHLDMIVRESKYDYLEERRSIEWFVKRGVDGIICFSLVKGNISFYKNLEYNNIVFVDNYMSGLEYDFVLVNNYDISKKATNYLIHMGHKNIVGLFVKDSYTSIERLKGFKDALIEANIPFDEKNNVRYVEEKVENAYQTVQNIFKHKDITAIYLSNYISTLGTIFLLNERKKVVPNDISIFGFDNIMLTDLFKPRLAIVNQPLEEMARKAVEILSSQISERKETKVITLECDIDFGESINNIA